MMAPVAANLFIAQAALPVLLLLLHGFVLPMQDFLVNTHSQSDRH